MINSIFRNRESNEDECDQSTWNVNILIVGRKGK